MALTLESIQQIKELDKITFYNLHKALSSKLKKKLQQSHSREGYLGEQKETLTNIK